MSDSMWGDLGAQADPEWAPEPTAVPVALAPQPTPATFDSVLEPEAPRRSPVVWVVLAAAAAAVAVVLVLVLRNGGSDPATAALTTQPQIEMRFVAPTGYTVGTDAKSVQAVMQLESTGGVVGDSVNGAQLLYGPDGGDLLLEAAVFPTTPSASRRADIVQGSFASRTTTGAVRVSSTEMIGLTSTTGFTGTIGVMMSENVLLVVVQQNATVAQTQPVLEQEMAALLAS